MERVTLPPLELNYHTTMTISKEYKEELTRQHAANPKWGSTAAKYAGENVLHQILINGQVQDVLDFGCGKGRLSEFIGRFAPNIAVTGYDPGIPGKDIIPPKRFGLTSSIDVFEHIEEEHIDDALRLMAQHTKYTLLLDIACTETGHLFTDGPYKGQDLHITLKTPEEWLDRVMSVLGEDFYLSKYSDTTMLHGKELRSRATIILNRIY